MRVAHYSWVAAKGVLIQLTSCEEFRDSKRFRRVFVAGLPTAPPPNIIIIPTLHSKFWGLFVAEVPSPLKASATLAFFPAQGEITT